MATLANQDITQTWENVSNISCTVQVLLGAVYVSYGDEPTGKQGHLLSIDGEQSIQNSDTIATWVRSTENHEVSIVAVTEAMI